MERRIALERVMQRKDVTVASDDGAVTFSLERCAGGVYMERTRSRPHARRIVQAIQFPDEASFVRWCEGDRLQFAYPLLLATLRRSGCALFQTAD